jgi:ATP synthase protein I
MSQPDDDSQEALRRLDERLEAFKADRPAQGSADGSAERAMGEGYRLLGEVLGSILGGLGLGWVFDHFAHTTPLGMVVGMLLGTAAAAYVAMKSADAGARRGTKQKEEG